MGMGAIAPYCYPIEERDMPNIPTPQQQVQLVKQSFAKIAPIVEQAADLFYGRLFEIAPQLRPLFKGDIKV